MLIVALVIAIAIILFCIIVLKLNASIGMVLASLFLLTAILGFFLSGTAVAVLVAPMAVDIGLKLGISPQACAMTVAIASSAVFVSPLGSAVHLLVRDPGGYVARDYAKVGTPLLGLALLATLALCWFFYLR